MKISNLSINKFIFFLSNILLLVILFLLTFNKIPVPRVQREEDQVRLAFDPAPTQMALCLRPCLLPTLKGESCYAPSQPSMTRLHNAELVNYECGRMNPLLCSRHHRQVTLAVKT